MMTGLHKRALGDAEAALRLRPGWAKAYVRQGEALAAAKDYAAARKSFQAATAIDMAFSGKVASMEQLIKASRRNRHSMT